MIAISGDNVVQCRMYSRATNGHQPACNYAPGASAFPYHYDTALVGRHMNVRVAANVVLRMQDGQLALLLRAEER